MSSENRRDFYRRGLLTATLSFFGWMLYFVLHTANTAAAAAVWPLIMAMLVVLMLPEQRLDAAMLVEVINSLKGNKVSDK